MLHGFPGSRTITGKRILANIFGGKAGEISFSLSSLNNHESFHLSSIFVSIKELFVISDIAKITNKLQATKFVESFLLQIAFFVIKAMIKAPLLI